MKLLSILKDLFTAPRVKTSSKSDHEDFMKLMQWGCYSDMNSSNNR